MEPIASALERVGLTIDPVRIARNDAQVSGSIHWKTNPKQGNRIERDEVGFIRRPDRSRAKRGLMKGPSILPHKIADAWNSAEVGLQQPCEKGGERGMRLLMKCAALAFAFVLSVGVANAETNVAQLGSLDSGTAAALQKALADAKPQDVQSVFDSVRHNPAALRAVAELILAAAESIKTTDPFGAGSLAALAYVSGGLQGRDKRKAQKLVNASGNLDARLFLRAFGSGDSGLNIDSAALGLTFNPVQMAQNGAQVVNQNSGSHQ